MICQKCKVNVVKDMRGISDGDKNIVLTHSKFITLCGPCRYTSFPEYMPRIQYQDFIVDYCKNTTHYE